MNLGMSGSMTFFTTSFFPPPQTGDRRVQAVRVGDGRGDAEDPIPLAVALRGRAQGNPGAPEHAGHRRVRLCRLLQRGR